MSVQEIVAVDPAKGVLLTEKYEPFVGEISNKGAGWMIFGGGTIVASPAVGTLTGILSDAPLLTILSAASLPFLVTLGMVLATSSEDLGKNRLWKKHRKWLKTQGFTKVATNSIDGINKWVSNPYPVTLEKLDGKKYVLKMVSVDGKKISSYEPVEKPKPKLIPVKNKWGILQSFTTTGQEITDSIQEQAKHLLSFSLSIEDQHAVERILSDTNELNKLGGMTEGSEPNKLYMRTLKTLQKEIKAVANQVNANMVRQLKIHASYVEGRNQVAPEFNLSQNQKVIS
jgi:hypothetical protein